MRRLALFRPKGPFSVVIRGTVVALVVTVLSPPYLLIGAQLKGEGTSPLLALALIWPTILAVVITRSGDKSYDRATVAFAVGVMAAALIVVAEM